MPNTLEDLNAGTLDGHSRIIIHSADLEKIPTALRSLATTLEHLDLSSNRLSELPDWFSCFQKLRILFLSSNNFRVFPHVLRHLPGLQMIAFRRNSMERIDEHCLPDALRWLILTENQLTTLPNSIGSMRYLEKLMLAGNRLSELPEAMSNLPNLTLLRLSSNCLTHLPSWLSQLPRLAFLAYASNTCSASLPKSYDNQPRIAKWCDFSIGTQLGAGASGIVYYAEQIHSRELPACMALKVFKGTITSDGLPADEISACISAGRHANIVSAIAQVIREGQPCLGFEYISPDYKVLGQPPSFSTCTRDCFPYSFSYDAAMVQHILSQIAKAMVHLHARQIMHDAHNIMVNEAGHAILSDFGAATIYMKDDDDANSLERVEVRAFGLFVEDMILNSRMEISDQEKRSKLSSLSFSCQMQDVKQRPSFTQLVEVLTDL